MFNWSDTVLSQLVFVVHQRLERVLMRERLQNLGEIMARHLVGAEDHAFHLALEVLLVLLHGLAEDLAPGRGHSEVAKVDLDVIRAPVHDLPQGREHREEGRLLADVAKQHFHVLWQRQLLLVLAPALS